MNITFDIDGIKEVVDGLSKIEKGCLDFRDLGAWNAVESEFYRIQREVFASEGSASKGGKWKALSSPYKEIKAAKWGDKPILQASGAMYKEFTSGAGRVDKQAQEMTLEFNSPAGYHMSKGARSKMPLRSSLDLTDEQQKRMLKPVADKLKQLIDNARLRSLTGR